MKWHYDGKLKFESSNAIMFSDVILNINFQGWAEHIYNNLKRISTYENHKTTKELDRKLLKLCREHSAKHKKRHNANNTIMLVHPFYLYLSHMNFLNTDNYRREANSYFETLFQLLNIHREKYNVNIIALDTIHHYPASTSFLLEQSLIDDIIFTVNDGGSPLNLSELDKFKDNDVFFGGGYNACCLSSAIHEMSYTMHLSGNNGKIHGIDGLMLNSPLNSDNDLLARRVNNLSNWKILELEELLHRIRK